MAKKNTLKDLTDYLSKKPHSFDHDKGASNPKLSLQDHTDALDAIKSYCENAGMEPALFMTEMFIQLLEQKESLSISEQMIYNQLLYIKLLDPSLKT